MDYTNEQIKEFSEDLRTGCKDIECCEKCKYGDLETTCSIPQKTVDIIEFLLSENADLRAKLAESEKREKAANIILQTEDDAGIPYEFEHYLCPGCHNVLAQRYKGSKAPLHTFKYCPDCGQHLEWRGVQAEKE